MPVIIENEEIRNIPEQVAKNAEDIEEIRTAEESLEEAISEVSNNYLKFFEDPENPEDLASESDFGELSEGKFPYQLNAQEITSDQFTALLERLKNCYKKGYIGDDDNNPNFRKYMLSGAYSNRNVQTGITMYASTFGYHSPNYADTVYITLSYDINGKYYLFVNREEI